MINEETVLGVDQTKYLASGLGDEMILMNLKTGDYIALNAVSAEIWKKAEESFTVRQIVSHLLQQYEVAEEECKKETLACIEELLQKELLVIM